MILEAIWIALTTMRANKVRTALTVLGNIIAVAALVMVVAFVRGINAEVSRVLLSRGADTLFVQRFGMITSEEEWERERDRPPLTIEEAEAIRRETTLAACVLAEARFRDTVQSARQSIQGVDLQARSPEYPEFLDETLEAGRHFSEAEDRHGATVAVLGSEVAESLFPGEAALGRSVRIASRHFLVIGVMKARGALLGQSQDKYVIIPLGSLRQVWGRVWNVDVAVKPRSPAQLDACADEVRAVLRARRGMRPAKDDTFSLASAASYLLLYLRATRAIYGSLIGLVALALVVGGIVIANVMLMVVTQRTREIGIRKAVGARRGQILAQFLVESATLSLVGGLAGLGLAAAVTSIASSVTPIAFHVEAWSVVAGLVLVLVVGMLAGLYPASRAASMDPIRALGHER